MGYGRSWLAGTDEISREELEEIGRKGFGVDLLYLPMYPMLMIDHVKIIKPVPEGALIAAEGQKDLYKHDWFFKAHFVNDSVMPGCLIVEGLWQIFSAISVKYLVMEDSSKGFSYDCINRARALGSKDLKFRDQTLPNERFIKYHVRLDKVITRKIEKGGKKYDIHLTLGKGCVKSERDDLLCSVSDIMVRFGPLFDEDYTTVPEKK